VNTENGDRLWRREQPFTHSYSIVFSPDGRFLAAYHSTGTRDPRKYWVSVWETHSGIEYRRWSSDLVASLAFHPDGNILALVKHYGEIQLWDIHTGVMIRELRGNQTRLRSLAFSPDGKILATGGYFEIGPLRIQQTIQLWDVPTGKPLRMIKGMREGGAPPIYTIVFSPDGRMLAAANGIENNTVTLWSVADGREVLTIGGLDLDAGTLRFSPDGRRLVTTASATLVWHLEELLAPFPPTSVTRLKPVKLVPRPVLLPNFPNPANPETWIPYQLHKAANVRISIHDVRGRLVRVLNIGHRAEGQYTCHCKAAYWDGCNNVGERVSSGLYFYSISAGGFRASRKMVLRK
jgi:dipeptidyl aminopeptidase/acylaminoacyl peptidase